MPRRARRRGLAADRGDTRLKLALLWLVGFSARVTLLAVPPLIPAMHRDLTLDETAIGALGGLPMLVLSAATLVGSLVIARLGARRAAIAGLLVLALAGALRGVGPAVPWLFAMTIVMAVGVALAQLAIPALVALWESHNVARATAVYGNGMLLGEIAGASITATAIVAIVGGSWELALALWSVVVIAVALALLTRPEDARPAVPPRWWPEWRDGRVWMIGLTFGSASIAYWGGNAHLPDYLHATGHAADVPLALASLNGAQLPASLLVGVWPALVVARRWPFVASGVVTVVCALGLTLTDGGASAAWAGVIGLVSALVFLLALALPPLLVPKHEVHRFSAAVFTISYAFAFTGQVVGGALWDATGLPAMALAPTAAAGVLMIALGSRIGFRTG